MRWYNRLPHNTTECKRHFDEEITCQRANPPHAAVVDCSVNIKANKKRERNTLRYVNEAKQEDGCLLSKTYISSGFRESYSVMEFVRKYLITKQLLFHKLIKLVFSVIAGSDAQRGRLIWLVQKHVRLFRLYCVRFVLLSICRATAYDMASSPQRKPLT